MWKCLQMGLSWQGGLPESLWAQGRTVYLSPCLVTKRKNGVKPKLHFLFAAESKTTIIHGESKIFFCQRIIFLFSAISLKILRHFPLKNKQIKRSHSVHGHTGFYS